MRDGLEKLGKALVQGLAAVEHSTKPAAFRMLEMMSKAMQLYVGAGIPRPAMKELLAIATDDDAAAEAMLTACDYMQAHGIQVEFGEITVKTGKPLDS